MTEFSRMAVCRMKKMSGIKANHNTKFCQILENFCKSNQDFIIKKNRTNKKKVDNISV